MQKKSIFLICVTVLSTGVALERLAIADNEEKGIVHCEVLENGKSASGIIILKKADKEIFNGLCKNEIAVPPGSYTAWIRLDGVLNSPEQDYEVMVKKESPARVVADFPTGILEVRIQSKGKNAAGMAIIKDNNLQIGTLGSGVSAHISAGSYQVIARYRTQKKNFEKVVIKAKSHVVLNAEFK